MSVEGIENKQRLQTLSIDNAWSNKNFLFHLTFRMLQHTSSELNGYNCYKHFKKYNENHFVNFTGPLLPKKPKAYTSMRKVVNTSTSLSRDMKISQMFFREKTSKYYCEKRK